MTKMNIGEAVGDLTLAALIGNLRADLGGTLDFNDKYSPRMMGAIVNVNGRIGSDVAGPGRGSEMAPYQTIGAAVAAMGKATTQLGYEAVRTLVVDGPTFAGGSHNVAAVTLPMGRWNVILKGGAVLVGALKQELVVAQAFTSTLDPEVAITNGDGVPVIEGPSFESFEWVQGSGANVTAARFQATKVNATAAVSIVTGPATLLPDIILEDVLATALVYVTANLFLTGSVGNFSRVISVNSITDLAGYGMNDDVTVVSAANYFRGTLFSAAAHTFTGPATSAKLTGDANFKFKVGPWVLAGGATKAIQTDVVP